MHIEPGILSHAKVLAANVACGGLLLTCAPAWLKAPTWWLRTALAAVCFTLLMQAFHMPVGPSELHVVGAMPIYLTLGFLPTLFGFAAGLLLQGLVFEPQDLYHLGVNVLSLAVPLVALHATLGRRVQDLRVATLLKLDGAYYAGVTAMVGFWLALGSEATPLADWAAFAASYLAIVALEPLLTLAIVRGVRAVKGRRWARACFDERLTA